MGRHRAGKRAQTRIHLPFAATRPRRSCWSREETAVEAHAQLTDVVLKVTVPVGGHTGGTVKRARCRVRWCAEAEGSVRAAGGARQGRAAARRAEGRARHTSAALERFQP